MNIKTRVARLEGRLRVGAEVSLEEGVAASYGEVTDPEVERRLANSRLGKLIAAASAKKPKAV